MMLCCIHSLMDAGRLFYTDSSTAMKRDHMVPVLKSFTQVSSSPDAGFDVLLLCCYVKLQILAGLSDCGRGLCLCMACVCMVPSFSSTQ